VARINGKSGAIYAQSARTQVTVAAALTVKSGLVFELKVATVKKAFWDPTSPPTIVGGAVASIDYINGEVTFVATPTTPTVNGIWYSDVIQCGTFKEWSVNLDTEIADCSVLGEAWKSGTIGQKSWSGSMSGYYLNSTWFDAAIAGLPVYLKLFEDYANTVGVVGAAFVKWGVKVALNATVEETVGFTGVGELDKAL
jgi:hypothetical protein